MKLADLPPEVIEDLSRKEKWRIDIDPGFNAKHEFGSSWNKFVNLSQHSFYESTEEDLAEFIEYDGKFILLPVERSHHSSMAVIRGMMSRDFQSITLFIHDSYHQYWFTEESDARYGFLAIADLYQKFNSEFYLANYYHFSYLVNSDFEVAKNILRKKL